MAINVRVIPKFSNRVKRRTLKEIALKALRAENASEELGLTLVVTDNRTISDLNRRFHDADMATDVLSFGSDEPGYLGDIVISFETARQNARRAGWRIQDELELLVVHGVLHLLGYDDLKPDLRKRMWQRQAEILGVELDAIDTLSAAN